MINGISRRKRLALAGVLVLVIPVITVFAALFYTSFIRVVAWEGEASTLDELVDGWASLPDIPGVILYVEEGDDVVYARAEGTVRKGGTQPLAADTPFHIASVGKLFTAATVLRLHERGILDLDAPAVRYVGPELISGLVVVEGQDVSERITVRQLLAHRSGLPNTDDDLLFGLWIVSQPDRVRTPQELLDHARRIGAVGPPGAQRSYASPGYFLLGLVIEGATGRPYHEVVRAELFEPLQMNATYEAAHEWPEAAVALHHYVGWIDFAQIHPSFEFADGGFVSTAPDLARFGHAMADGTLFDKPGTHALFIGGEEQSEFDAEIYYGLGPLVARPPDGPAYLFHGGAWGVQFVVYPQQDAVVIFALGQSQADAYRFWQQLQPHLKNELRMLP